MPTDLVAALPMYNVTPQLAQVWRELAQELNQRLDMHSKSGRLEILSTDEGSLDAIWRRSDLLLSQTCGYPLTHGLAEHVHVLGVPIFDAPGCERHFYSSAIVVRRADRTSSLEDYRGKIAACNDDDSHSGMNALPHAIAPLAIGGRFFSGAFRTGSHLLSLRAVCEHRADIAAIDCVTLAFARDVPGLTEPLRTLGFTRSAPGLPFIASRSLGRDTLRLIGPALNDVIASHALLAGRLRLRGLVLLPVSEYQPILDMEAEAARAGYPNLLWKTLARR
ncbi:phosphate ABC transporter substrate-binding protein [Paraburkholderia sp. UYCP14C]|uniref:phosphate/phosphite/phosphonate ABC transporter substrate-binding protein n=1 Tax=Paraburkholderia sp. UYCP14C TaxID=2511130 RepID=UPI00101E9C61|nr:PhnD/SsuA/transferrin family substrate-binding protein [Paraburkholderia sp. UYCP14C]RZF25162.1 phosphate ABC transporter substrate-binding protein [Paraburkholderia sp. UYCP14C]